MSDPTPPQPQPGQIPVNVGAQHVPAAQAPKPVIAITFGNPYGSQSFITDLDTALALPAALAAVLSEIEQAVRAASAGLIVAQPGMVPPMNGQHPQASR